MWQLVSLLVVFSIMICSSAEPIRGNRIRSANRRQFPFIVGIATNSYGERYTDNYICTGTLLSKSHVLTASHCIMNYLEVDLRVLVGYENLEFCTPYEIDLWEIYDTWAMQNDVDVNNDNKNDIAVIRLSKAVIHPTVRPAILPPRGFRMPFNSNIQVAGWGESNTGYPSILQTATLTLKSPNDCNLRIRSFPDFKPLDEREFCTMADPYILLGCGDSGGPVVYNGNTIIGMNVAGCIDVPLKDQINIHINLNYFRDFIDDVMAKKY